MAPLSPQYFNAGKCSCQPFGGTGDPFPGAGGSGRHTAGQDNGSVAVIRGGLFQLLHQAIGNALLERGSQVGHRQGLPLLFHPVHDVDYRSL